MLDLKSKKVNGPVIRLNGSDNVVVARLPIEEGVSLEGYNIVTRNKVPAGYKVAVHDIKKGEAVLKYNTTIGFASEDIAAGTMVHNHNIAFQEFDRDYAYSRDFKPLELLPESERATFQGYMRADGRGFDRQLLRHGGA
jgi:altronate hydrolase